MTRPRLLVLGGTGRLAGLLRRWETGAYDITWVARPGPQGGAPGTAVFDMRTDPAALATACRAADVILDLSGPTTNPARPAPGFAAIPDLARVLRHAAGDGPVLWMSSAAVYGAREGAREDDPLVPLSEYGRAKARGEAVFAGAANVTILRLGNVAGADALLGQIRQGVRVQLDRFPDGTTPRRAYIGPKTLVKSLFLLMDSLLRGDRLPPVLNLAAPGPGVEMAALLAAARIGWQPQDASESALRASSLDTALLNVHVPLPPETGTPAGLVAEWRADLARAAGWG